MAALPVSTRGYFFSTPYLIPHRKIALVIVDLSVSVARISCLNSFVRVRCLMMLGIQGVFCDMITVFGLMSQSGADNIHYVDFSFLLLVIRSTVLFQ